VVQKRKMSVTDGNQIMSIQFTFPYEMGNVSQKKSAVHMEKLQNKK
jgi:hypothetical protein